MKSSASFKLTRILVAAMFMIGIAATVAPSGVRAGDGVFRVSGRVMACSTDLSTESINSAIPPSCNTDIEGAAVTVTTSQPSAESTTLTASSATDGSFSFSPGYADTFSIIVQTDLDPDHNAGFLSCIYQELDGAYAGEAVFPLDSNGAAEIIGGAPLWYQATCNFFLYKAAGGETAFIAGVLQCDIDMSVNPDPPLGERCPLAGSLLRTQLTFPDGTNQQQTTDEQGGVTYSGLISGENYAISVDRPSFYDGTIAFCDERASDGTLLVNEFTIEATSEGAIPFSIQNSGATIRCTIAVYPKDVSTDPGTDDELTLPGTVSIDIGKYECPSGFSGDAVEDYWDTCELTEDAIGFDLFGNETGESQFQETGEIADGVVIFEGLSPDEWQISEVKPDGYGDPAVYCSTVLADDSQGGYLRMDVFDGVSISQTVEDGSRLTCEWFNIPGDRSDDSSGSGSDEPDGSDGRSFAVNLLTCPTDYERFAEDADPEFDCEEAAEGVTFTATDEDGQSTSATTDSSGEALLDLSDASGDLFELTQDYPEDVQSSIIWDCELNGDDIDSPFQPVFELNGTNLTHVNIEEGDQLSCVWLNLPTSPADDDGEDTGTVDGVLVSVTVLECPGIPNPASCDQSEEGFQLLLTDVSDPDTAFEFETGENGIASGDVPPGEYEISADLTPCFVDSSAITENGTLLVQPDSPVDMTLFVCN